MRKTLLVLAAFCCSTSFASAVIVTGGTPGTGTGPGMNGLLSMPVVVTTGSENTGGPTGGDDPDGFGPALAPNVITFELTALELGMPFTIEFDVSAGAGAGDTEYLLDFGFKNGLAGPRHLSGFDIQASSGTGGYSVTVPNEFPAGSRSISDSFWISPDNLPTGIRFGGMSGSGGSLASDDVARNQTPILVSYSGLGPASGKISLTFTANPEPTTLALAGLCLIPAGIAVRRRRKQQVVAE